MNPYIGAMIGAAVGYALTKGKCHPATQDKMLNKENKGTAVDVADYGPNPFGSGVGLGRKVKDVFVPHLNRVLSLMVSTGDNDYWEAKAERMGESLEHAREEVCGNCKAFDVSDAQVDCGGAGGKLVAVVCASDEHICSLGEHPKPTRTVGFCQAYKFSCSAFRTCDSWVSGGPQRL